MDPWVRPGRPELGRDFRPYTVHRRAGTSRRAIVFVHISKSAGSTMKRALTEAAKASGLQAPFTLFRRTWPKFLKACQDGSDICDRDLYVGTNALGACDYVKRDHCIYATVLRHPIDRIRSSWHYFCQQGAENKKGWHNGQHCDLSVTQWARLQPGLATMELSTNQAPVHWFENQSMSCPLLADAPANVDRAAHLRVALTNVGPVGGASTGPIHALLVDHLAADLRTFASFFHLRIDAVKTSAYRENHRVSESSSSSSSPRESHGLDDHPNVLRELKEILYDDITLYDAVRSQRRDFVQNQTSS